MTPPEATKLPDDYDSALLGTAIFDGTERFCYSLRKLVRFKMMEHTIPASEAREEVLISFVRPYATEVAFVNDELVSPISDDEKPVIIVPGKFGKQ